MGAFEVAKKNVITRPLRSALIVTMAALGVVGGSVLVALVSGTMKALSAYGEGLNPRVIIVLSPAPLNLSHVEHVVKTFPALITDAYLACNNHTEYVMVVGYTSIKELEEVTSIKLVKGKLEGTLVSPEVKAFGTCYINFPFIGNIKVNVTGVVELPQLKGILKLPLVLVPLKVLNLKPNALILIVDKARNVKYVVHELKKILPKGTYIISRTSLASLVSAIASVGSVLSALVGASTLLIVVVTTTLIMIMEIRSRKWEIGILKAVGFDNFEVGKVFLYESLIYALAASLVALPLASFTLKAVQGYVETELSPFGLNVKLDRSVIWIVDLAMVISLVLGAVIPAWLAFRLEPSEALRTY